jgi:hypothetical protein
VRVWDSQPYATSATVAFDLLHVRGSFSDLLMPILRTFPGDGAGIPQCDVLLDTHKGSDGNSRIGPYQSETQYLEEKIRVIAEWQQSVNKALTCSRFVAALLPLPSEQTPQEATKWQYVAATESYKLN